MRRRTSALTTAIVGAAVSASTIWAQQFLPPTANREDETPATTTTAAPAPPVPVSTATDPGLTGEKAPVTGMAAARGARYLLRNGLDYIDYQEYDRALKYLREAEAQQVQLNDAEKLRLKQGLEKAQRGLREAVGSQKPYALSNRPHRAGGFSPAKPETRLAAASSAPQGQSTLPPLQATRNREGDEVAEPIRLVGAEMPAQPPAAPPQNPEPGATTSPSHQAAPDPQAAQGDQAGPLPVLPGLSRVGDEENNKAQPDQQADARTTETAADPTLEPAGGETSQTEPQPPPLAQEPAPIAPAPAAEPLPSQATAPAPVEVPAVPGLAPADSTDRTETMAAPDHPAGNDPASGPGTAAIQSDDVPLPPLGRDLADPRRLDEEPRPVAVNQGETQAAHLESNPVASEKLPSDLPMLPPLAGTTAHEDPSGQGAQSGAGVTPSDPAGAAENEPLPPLPRSEVPNPNATAPEGPAPTAEAPVVVPAPVPEAAPVQDQPLSPALPQTATAIEAAKSPEGLPAAGAIQEVSPAPGDAARAEQVPSDGSEDSPTMSAAGPAQTNLAAPVQESPAPTYELAPQADEPKANVPGVAAGPLDAAPGGVEPTPNGRPGPAPVGDAAAQPRPPIAVGTALNSGPEETFIPERKNPTSSLGPELRRQVEEIARRQDREEPAYTRSLTQEPSNPLGTTTTTDRTQTQVDISRAPSPAEARPIRAIPVPEDWVPLARREWSASRKYWAAAATCHMPLYFQDVMLERYGHSVETYFGPTGGRLTYPIDDPAQSTQRNQLIQPAFSVGLFAWQLITWPYALVVDPPWEAQYDLGYWRPGDRIPTDLYYQPLHGTGPPLRGRNY